MKENFQCAYTELVSINKVFENPKNPNKHKDDQIKRLAEIIEYQGQRQAIVISKNSGYITKGHGRLAALRLLGWDKVAVDYQTYTDEAQEYADIVADNAIKEWSSLDLGLVKSELLNFNSFGVNLLGFKNFEIIPNKDNAAPVLVKPDERETIHFKVTHEQKDILDEAISKALRELDCQDGLNSDFKTNALVEIVKLYLCN